MALLECDDCGSQYSVGAPKCPECGSRKKTEVGAPPKTAKKTAAEGPVADESEGGE